MTILFVSYAEYKEAENLYSEYEDLSFDIVFQMGGDDWKFSPLATILFDDETLEELEYHANLLNEF